MTTIPKWSTPERQTYLVKLFLDSGGFCVYGHKQCTIDSHHYELYSEGQIDYWKAQDREEARLDWIAECKALHSLGERRLPLRGRFNNIAIDIWHNKQPLFYLEAMGISGLTLKPFAKVKIGSSFMHLYVDLGDSLKRISKNRKRKAIRYGKALPLPVQARIIELVKLAVRDYLK